MRRGREVGWQSVGSGPPLVVVNGYAGTAADWDPTFISELGTRFQVFLPDNRGMGASSWGDDTEVLTIASMAGDVLALADALDLSTFALAGWSMGGFIAQTLASREPERVSALALLGTDPGGPGAVRADPAVWARLIDVSGSDRQQATRLLSLLFPPDLAAELDAQVGPIVAQARAEIDHRVLRAQEDAMDAWHTAPSPVIPAAAPPTLVACGDLDIVLPAANAPIIAERWGAPAPLVFPGCGHAFMAQVPVELAAHLIDHLG